MVEDREGDIYECFAFKPANVEKLVRAAQDRSLADGTSLFSKADGWDEAGRMTVEFPATPGRKARRRSFPSASARSRSCGPANRKAADGLPKTIGVTLVIGREIDPPEGEEPAQWFLLTTHRVDDIADARRIIGFYRLRWTIEQLFRTMKTKGFDVEALRQEQDGPLEKLVTAILIAAIKVMQLVAERDGEAKRPLATSSIPTICLPWNGSVKASKARPQSRRTRIPTARSPMPPGSSQGSAAGPATTESPVPSSCSEASPNSTPSSMDGASEMCEIS